MSKWKQGDIIIVSDPIRMYEVIAFDGNRYTILYKGPEKPPKPKFMFADVPALEHALVRKATKAEIILYTNKSVNKHNGK